MYLYLEGSWVNWLNEPKLNTRDNSFHGCVKLLLPVHPWTITLQLQALTICPESIQTLFGSEVLSNLFSAEDVRALFNIGNRFRLQIEPANTELPSAVVESTLSEKSEDGRGILLGFQFHSIDNDLEELIVSTNSGR